MAGILLGSARTRYPRNSQHAQLWMLEEQQLAFHRALLRCDWLEAEAAVKNLSAINVKESTYWYEGFILLTWGQKGESKIMVTEAQNLDRL